MNFRANQSSHSSLFPDFMLSQKPVMKMTTIAKTGFLALALMTAAGVTPALRAADAKPPARVSYQGFLVDGNGAPLANSNVQNFDVVFRLYNASQGGASLWSEQQTVTVDKGNFSVFLGEGTAVGGEPRPALDVVFSGADASDRYIGMTVLGLGGAVAEIAPRLRLLTAPYAFLARNATAVVGPSGNSILTASGTSIGINTASPTTALDVNGVVTSTGAKVNGAINATTLNVSGAAAVGDLTLNGTVSGPGLSTLGGVPIGAIILWSGTLTTIPNGWALCDGSTKNGRVTPDLRERFVIGAGSTGYAPGTTGGAHSVTLSQNHLPPHTHEYRDRFFAEVGLSGSGGAGAEAVSNVPGSKSGNDNDNNRVAYFDRTTGSAGAGVAVDIRPRFYALAYIMRVQ